MKTQTKKRTRKYIITYKDVIDNNGKRKVITTEKNSLLGARQLARQLYRQGRFISLVNEKNVKLTI